jgi:hypothetical protein
VGFFVKQQASSKQRSSAHPRRRQTVFFFASYSPVCMLVLLVICTHANVYMFAFLALSPLLYPLAH